MAADRTGIKWSREGTILAFALYCRTPFGKISQGNPEIIKLADLLGRTPGSVGLKMGDRISGIKDGSYTRGICGSQSFHLKCSLYTVDCD